MVIVSATRFKTLVLENLKDKLIFPLMNSLKTQVTLGMKMPITLLTIQTISSFEKIYKQDPLNLKAILLKLIDLRNYHKE